MESKYSSKHKWQLAMIRVGIIFWIVFSAIWGILCALYYYIGALDTLFGTVEIVFLLFSIGMVLYRSYEYVEYIRNIPSLDAKMDREKLEEENSKKVKYYRECEKRNLLNLSISTNKQKAMLLAKDYGYTDDGDFDTFFSNAKQLAFPVIEEENRSRLNELKKKEAEEIQKLSKYSEYYGSDKRLHMLSDIASQCRQGAYALRNLDNVMMQVAIGQQQKEHSWATHGGIASGIAGPVAGLATAIDIQNKNAEIRANNQSIMNNYMSGTKTMRNSATDLDLQARAAEEEYNEAKLKLIARMPDCDVFSMLDISSKDVSISETGSFKVKATLSRNDRFSKKVDPMYEIIDGSVVANLYQNGQLVSSAYLVLPLYGVESRSYCTIEGMGKGSANPKDPYTVKYSANKLWLMEK